MPDLRDRAGLCSPPAGVPRGYFYENLDTAIVPVIEAALAHLRDAGAVLVEADIPDLQPLNDAVGFPLALYEVMRDLPNYLADVGAGVTLPDLAAQMLVDFAGHVSPPVEPRQFLPSHAIGPRNAF